MTNTVNQRTPEIADGRHRRRVANLEAVVTATLDLISEHGALPTVAEVAQRASISQRSVFRYFTDVDQLTRAAIDTRYREASSLAVLPQPLPNALEDRLVALATSRERLFEFIGPTARVARTKLIDNPIVIDSVVRSREQLRRQLRDTFSPELDALGAEADSALAALDVLFSFESWDLLRRDRGLSPDDAASVLGQAGLRILTA